MQILPSSLDWHQSRQKLWLFAALAFLAVTLCALVVRDHQRTIANETERLRGVARVADENIGRQLETLGAALAGVRSDLPFFAKGDYREALPRRLAALTDALPGVRTLLVVDAEGRVLASNRVNAIGQSVAQRTYFKQLSRQADAQMLYLSEPFTTTSDVFSLNAVKVVLDAAGSFQGLIAATLDPEYFAVLLRSLIYAPDMRATLVHGDGKIFMSVPVNKAILGRDLAVRESNFSMHRATGAEESMTEASTYSLGEQRLTAWRNIQPMPARMDKPLVLAVGRELGATMAPWRRTAFYAATGYVVVSVLAFFGLRLFQRRQLLRAADRQERSETARRNADRVDLALAGASLGLWDVDLVTLRTTINARYHEMLGYPAPEGFGTLDELIAKMHAEDVQVVEDAFAHAQRSEDGVVDMELRMQHRDGHWVWFHAIGRVTERDAAGKALRATGTQQDISDRKATEAQIWDMAFYDPLTRLPNRRLLMDRIAQTRVASERSGQMAAVMFVDLDHFKALNDSRGHAAGDQLLREVGARLAACVRQSDTVARLAGDEFVLLLQNLNDTVDSAKSQAQSVAQKALLALQAPYTLDGGDFGLTASIGVTLFRGRECSAEHILDLADQAMYRAKRAGRNVVEVCEAAHVTS